MHIEFYIIMVGNTRLDFPRLLFQCAINQVAIDFDSVVKGWGSFNNQTPYNNCLSFYHFCYYLLKF